MLAGCPLDFRGVSGPKFPRFSRKTGPILSDQGGILGTPPDGPENRLKSGFRLSVKCLGSKIQNLYRPQKIRIDNTF